MNFYSGFYDPFLSAKKQLEELFSPTMANVEKTATSESSGETTISTPTTNMINSMMATPTPAKRENDSKKLSNNSSMTRSLTSYSSFTPKTPQPLPRSQPASNFKRTSSLRLSNRSKPKWTPPPPKSENIHCGIEDDGPISPNFVKATDYDEIPVGSPIAAAAAMKLYEGKIPVKIPPTKITAMPVIVNTTHTPLLRERHNLMSRKTNMKLDIRNPNQPSTDNSSNALSKTDSLAMFLKYEKELTSKELKDKSNCISKQNLTKDNKLPDINATSNDKRIDESAKESQSKSHSAPPLMKMSNACDNLPSLMTSNSPANISDSDKSRSPSVDRKVDDENDSPSSTTKRGSGSALRRKMKYNLENILYDTDPEVKSNRSSGDNSIDRPVSRLSNTESIFEDFDFDQFIASFNDDDKFPIFKDYKMMMNTKSKADEEMKISSSLKTSPNNITKHENITNCNTKNVVKSLNDSFPIPIQSPPIRKLPEDDALSGFEKLDNLCKMLAGNSDSDESNSLEADQNRSKSSADSAYGR